MEDILVTDVRLVADQGRITLFGLPDKPGNCSRVFQAVAKGGIVVDMIVQNMTAGRPELSFSVPQPDLARALELSREVARSIEPATEVFAEGNIATVYVQGVGMRTHTGVARKMFGALARRGINISMINTSEVRLSVVVDRIRGGEALECLREAFNLG
jgi:aspartate kinase